MNKAIRYTFPSPTAAFLALLACFTFFAFFLPGASRAAANDYIGVYDSGLQDGWIVHKWEGGIPIGVDTAATAPGLPGTAVEVNFTDNGWNAFGFGTPDWSEPYFLNEIKTIEFDVYIEPDSVGTENLVFILSDAGLSDQPRLVDFIPGWNSLPDAERFGHWFHIGIDLASLHPQIANFGRFLLFNAADSASKPHFRLYDVKLGWQEDTTPPQVTLQSITPDLTFSRLTLVFDTDEPTTYRVEYGVSGFDAQVENLDAWAKHHEAVLPDLTPGTMLNYRIIARDHRMEPGAAPNEGILEGSFELPSAPTQPPQISKPKLSGVEGHKAVLSWSTDRPCSAVLTYKKQGGAAMTRTLDDYRDQREFSLDLLEPSTTYVGTIKVRDVFGLQASRRFTLRTKAGSTTDVDIRINPNIRQPISPYIYGTNQQFGASHYTFGRLGGNRWTAYNWENNASNAGADWFNQNDDFLPWILGVPADQYDVPGNAILYGLNQIFAPDARAAGALITVPVLGHVAADRAPGGDVADSGPDYLQTRFKELSLAKGAPFSLHPSTTDAKVYTDEYVHWVKKVAQPAHPGKRIFYSLDNEPDLWRFTHPRIQPEQVSYDGLCDKNEAAALAVKRVDAKATVFGFVSYGWYGYTYLQGAPDGSGSDHAALGDFTEYYLDRMQAAETKAGKRLVDVLDLHYYTSAETADGSPVGYFWDGSKMASLTTPEAIAERVQSARSLWDPAYVENSWITRDGLEPGDQAIRLIPRMQAKIDAHYPGTKLAITEYNFGGGADISGAIAEADALGIFGQMGIFAANRWQMGDNGQDHEEFIEAAFRMYRGFDGKSANFGNLALATTSSDTAKVAVYASLDSKAAQPRSVLVAINRSQEFQDVALNGLPVQGTAQVYRLTAASTLPGFVGQVPVTGDALVVALPPMSISTIQIR